MLVVADSSPLHYLVLIRQVQLLPRLFDRVVIPGEVVTELAHQKAPQAVREFIANKPDWLSVRNPRCVEPIPEIDPGEQAAISLAREIGADLLLIDDLDGRRVAQQVGLIITGTLGVLDRAAEQGLLDLREALNELRTTSMHLSASLVASLVRRHDEPR